MAYDAGIAAQLRAEIAAMAGSAGKTVSEKKMFGGLCIFLDGNMVGGVMKDAVIFRVGKDRMDAALDMPAVGLMRFAKRRMGGMAEIGAADFSDGALRAALLDMAVTNAASLPAKALS